MSFAGFTFARPLWLAVGIALAAAIAALSVYSARRRKLALRSFGPRTASSMSSPLRALKHGLVALGLLCGCIALARPQRGFRWEEARRRGVDLMFAIDTSKSMLAPDLKPDRLTRAKLAVHDLVQKFEGDRVGITAFAGDAFLECPLTLDRGMFEQTLDALDTKIIPRGGTDVGAAITTATEAMRNEPGNEKVLVLLTDGEDLEAHAVDAAKAALHAGVHVYTVGVGTAAGELLPLSPGVFVRDASGAFVRSRLDEQTLGAIADAGGGQYRLLGAGGHGLDALYTDVISRLPKEALGEKQNRVPLERYQWPLAVAIALLGAEALLPERRRRGAAALAALLVLAVPGAAHASPRAVERGYDVAAAAYKRGDLPAAASGYEQAVHGGDVALQQRAYYDLGDVQYRIGEKDVKTAPDKTIAAWKQALASYDGALALDGKDADAKFNRDLVKRKLDALEQQQKQKQDQQKQDQQKRAQNQQQQQKGQQPKDQQQKGQQPKDQHGQGQQQAQNQPGQQPKDQHGQGQQQAQNQPGQQPKDQHGQGQQQAQNQPGQQPKDQHGQGQQQAQNQPGQQPKSAQPPAPADERGSEARAPGQLSKQEAAMLLDALRGNEKVRVATGTRGRATADQPVAKDW